MLKKYFKKWLEEATDQDFFYWLDIGDGRHVSLDTIKNDRLITRTDLESSRVKYCTAHERKRYATTVNNTRHLTYTETGEHIHTCAGTWIFVLDTHGTLFVGPKQRGFFHHSSFLAGGPALAAGRITVEHGIVRTIEAHSGHYRPEKRHFDELLLRLDAHGLDLSTVEIDWSVLEHNKRKAT